MKYRITIQSVNENFVIEKGYNSIQLINKGASTAYINGYPLPPNEVLPIVGNEDDICDTNLSVIFAGTGVNNLFIIQKVYVC